MEFACIITVFLFLVGCIALFFHYQSRKEEKREEQARQRIITCNHPNGFRVLKIFGHPDMKECVDCGRIFEQDGTEVDLEYVEHLRSWMEQLVSNDGRKQVSLSLPFESFQKLYLLSMQHQITMDDMAAEIIENYNKNN